MPPDNRAAWLQAQCKSLEVTPAPYTPPDKGQVVIKGHALAINPVNWIKQHAGQGYAPWIQLPFVMGSDVAGEVVEVGSDVAQVRVGDRVLGHAMCMNSRINNSSEGAFQEYTVLRSNLVSAIPDSMSYESACVLPLGLSTAARGLFTKEYLSLSLPTASPPSTSTESIKQTLLIWGGSTSVGCNAIQLASAAGYEVIATASPKNHEFLKSIGATLTFDYRSPTVVKDIVTLLEQPERVCVGALAVGQGSLTFCVDILGDLPPVTKSHSRNNSTDTNETGTDTTDTDTTLSTTGSHESRHVKFIAQVTLDILPPAAQARKGSDPLNWASLPDAAPDAAANAKAHADEKGVKTKFVIASEIVDDPVAGHIYNAFLPEALQSGRYVTAPEAMVVGKGLEAIQEAMNVSRRGVSAKKVVVSL